MKDILFAVVVLSVFPGLLAAMSAGPVDQTAAQKVDLQKWAVHDETRPLPPVVDPGPAGPPAPAPSDAVVLFDGRDLSGWQDVKGEPAKWKVEGGYMEVVAKTGSIRTKQGFGDCQLHVEWASPAVVIGESQGRGNSGVFLMDIYEIQVLDGYNNKTYADGSAASVYGQYPPLVNACRKPGEWQTYDIIFHRPRFDAAGKVASPARVTVLHNGVLVQDDVELTGPTAHKARPPYKAHADKLPLSLQDHGNPVRYRDIWIRPLE
jgi:3-keto-disaccharide hydrolase